MATKTMSTDKVAQFRSALLAEHARFAVVNQGNLEVLALPGG